MTNVTPPLRPDNNGPLLPSANSTADVDAATTGVQTVFPGQKLQLVRTNEFGVRAALNDN